VTLAVLHASATPRILITAPTRGSHLCESPPPSSHGVERTTCCAHSTIRLRLLRLLHPQPLAAAWALPTACQPLPQCPHTPRPSCFPCRRPPTAHATLPPVGTAATVSLVSRAALQPERRWRRGGGGGRDGVCDRCFPSTVARKPHTFGSESTNSQPEGGMRSDAADATPPRWNEVDSGPTKSCSAAPI